MSDESASTHAAPKHVATKNAAHKQSALKIACIGEAMVELSLNETGDQAAIGYAGDTLNSAIYLRRMLRDRDQVSFVSVIGRDHFSDHLLQLLATEQVDGHLLSRHATKLLGLYAISKDEKGDRTFSYWRENSAARTLFSSDQDFQMSVLDGFDVIYLSAISLAILPPDIVAQLFDYLRGFRARGGRVAFDSNYRPRLWPSQEIAQSVIAEAWQITDIGMPSLDDEMALFGETDPSQTIQRFSNYQVPLLILKRGADGPQIFVSGAMVQLDLDFPQATHVVDTTAAGDSFNGGFLARHLMGASASESTWAGHELACRVIGYQGAILPKDELGRR